MSNFDAKFYQLLEPLRRSHVNSDAFVTFCVKKYRKKDPSFKSFADAWAKSHNLCVMMNSRAYLSCLLEKKSFFNKTKVSAPWKITK
jgi:hypothetical protein